MKYIHSVYALYNVVFHFHSKVTSIKINTLLVGMSWEQILKMQLDI